MSSEKIKILFNDSTEILHVVKNGDPISSLLGIPNEEKCSLIGADIKLISPPLGGGVFGQAFLIRFPHLDVGNRLYVVKRSQIQLSAFTATKKHLSDNIYREGVEKNIGLIQPQEFQDAFNNANDADEVTLVSPAAGCLIRKEMTFPAIPQTSRKQTVTVPKNSYICSDNNFSEYIIGSYVAKIYREKLCINYIDVYSSFICPVDRDSINNGRYYNYVFMDKIDGDSSNLFIKRNKDRDTIERYNVCSRLTNYFGLFSSSKNCEISHIIDGIFIQTIFAIAKYQQTYKISHNDLHCDNVFVEFVNDNTEFNGQLLNRAKWYHYKIGEENIYFPAIPVIVKIGDFGLSVKYSEPIIGDAMVFETGYDQYNGSGPWMPNYYVPAYDNLTFSFSFANLLDEKFSIYKLTPLLIKCFQFMCPRIDRSKINIIEQLAEKGYINTGNFRPVLDNLNETKNSMELLMGPILDKYGKTPIMNDVYTLGILSNNSNKGSRAVSQNPREAQRERIAIEPMFERSVQQKSTPTKTKRKYSPVKETAHKKPSSPVKKKQRPRSIWDYLTYEET